VSLIVSNISRRSSKRESSFSSRMSWFTRHPRWTLILVTLACVASVAFALYLQHYEKQKPCPLCVLGRYAFIAVALFSAVGVLMPKAALRLCSGLAALSSLAGIGVATNHNYNVLTPKPDGGCGADTIADWVNSLPSAEWFNADVFFSMGSCTDKYPPILGLSLPLWELIGFVVLFALLALITIKPAVPKERRMFAHM
jgi:protein dithiol:quinone oxidoreductase